MDTISRLLVATDLSGPSLRAVERALQLSRDTGASCTVVNALGLEGQGPLLALLGASAEPVTLRAIERQREALARLVGDPARRRGVETEVRVERGPATDAVPAVADAIGAQLLVAGAHGHGFLQRVLLGSTSSTLLRKSRCPVLIVKAPCRGPYRRALVPLDFSPSSETALRFVRRMVPRIELVLLHAFDVPLEGLLHLGGLTDEVVDQYRIDARQRALSRLHDLAARVGLQPEDYVGIVLHGNAVRHIVSQERHHACDLVVMGKHGTHLTEELLLGSVTKRVLAESRSDVLVVVDRRRPERLPGAGTHERT